MGGGRGSCQTGRGSIGITGPQTDCQPASGPLNALGDAIA